MTRTKAFKLAIQAMQREIKSLNVQANLHDTFGMKSGKTASKRRKELQEAIDELRTTQTGIGKK